MDWLLDFGFRSVSLVVDMDILKTVITAFLGSLGFALLYGLKRKHLIFASLGGLISWGMYLLFYFVFNQKGIFLPCFIATIITAVYVILVAICVKAPTHMFLLPALIPLIPGSTLYYTFLNFYRKEWNVMFQYAGETFAFVFAIAAGMSVVWLFKSIITKSNYNEPQ